MAHNRQHRVFFSWCPFFLRAVTTAAYYHPATPMGEYCYQIARFPDFLFAPVENQLFQNFHGDFMPATHCVSSVTDTLLIQHWNFDRRFQILFILPQVRPKTRHDFPVLDQQVTFLIYRKYPSGSTTSMPQQSLQTTCINLHLPG